MQCPHCKEDIPQRNPIPTVDIIIEKNDRIILIERKNPPFGWALPGGFVDYGESFETAALREAMEETGIEVENLTQFRTYSDPTRDKRFHTASTVFCGTTDKEPIAGDDAAKAEFFHLNKLPELAFDHARILEDYIAWSTNR